MAAHADAHRQPVDPALTAAARGRCYSLIG
jgi:hypothetical protein